MKIERVVIHELRALERRDDSFVGPDGVRMSTCLRGLNGSGKTTYLDAIARLWQWFRRCTQRRAYANPSPGSLLMDAGLVAVLFTDLPGPRRRMWVTWGKARKVRDFVETERDVPLHLAHGGVAWDAEVLDWWDQAYARAESGGEPVCNLVYIEAENKVVPVAARDEMSRVGGVAAFLPVARHSPTDRGPGHLEGQMRTLFLARREKWDMLVREIGRLRPGLRLLDRFDESTQRPLFQTASGATITVDRLSAGERSVLINLCLILRWLGPGGIVLLDEPELHQHVSLMRGSIAVTEQIVDEVFRGQLVVASHAPEVWDHFRAADALVELEG